MAERPSGSSARPESWGLVQAVLLIYTARTFLPGAYDLLASGRPSAGQQPIASGAASALTRLLTVSLCVAVLACFARRRALRFPPLAAAAVGLVLVEVFSAVKAGGASLLAPLLASAVLVAVLSAGLDRDDCVRLARRCLAPVVLGSLALAVLAPHIAKFGLTDAVWGTRDARLAGITPQPNTMGAVAGAFVVTLLSQPRRRSSLALLGAGAAALYLSQSYTSWLATGVAVAVVLTGRGRRARSGTGSALPLAVTAVGVAAVLVAVTRLSVLDHLGSVSGRRELWDLVWQRWTEAPVLGHGPQIWADLIAAGVLPGWAVHAHDQLLNTLFVSGLVGAAVLAWLLALLVGSSARSWSQGATLGAGLVALQLVRSYSEVPFELFFGGFNVVLLALAGAGVLSPAPAAPVQAARERVVAWAS